MAATAPPPPSLHHAVNAFTAPWMTHQLQQHHLQPLSATIAERCHHWRRTIVRCPHHVRTTAPARTRFANQSAPALQILRALTPAAMETTFSIAQNAAPPPLRTNQNLNCDGPWTCVCDKPEQLFEQPWKVAAATRLQASTTVPSPKKKRQPPLRQLKLPLHLQKP